MHRPRLKVLGLLYLAAITFTFIMIADYLFGVL